MWQEFEPPMPFRCKLETLQLLANSARLLLQYQMRLAYCVHGRYEKKNWMFQETPFQEMLGCYLMELV
jgi:hypothetical protein